MLIAEIIGRRILLSSDEYEELQKVKLLVTKMEEEHDVKVYDKEDHVIVFVTNPRWWPVEILVDIEKGLQRN